ncbi:MerR family transcriptional regulator [uncultured Anaerofustis sp.]|uniref:MerR family transcriptional regulator n=1 Tax=uncultured Anaerofustis sp. TaxID=904996 RepID=UPI0025FE09F9|nr:MerR family transcriptional regulator [uncultured Anaerofustis sp.]
MYTVKDVSKKLNLSEHTIRYYTDKDLIPSVKRNKNNVRLFDEESINWFIGIKCLKDCGMSIEDIKKYIDLCLEGDSTVEERFDIILKQKEIAERQLEEAKDRLIYLENKVKHYEDIMNGDIPDNTNPQKKGYYSEHVDVV